MVIEGERYISLRAQFLTREISERSYSCPTMAKLKGIDFVKLIKPLPKKGSSVELFFGFFKYIKINQKV